MMKQIGIPQEILYTTSTIAWDKYKEVLSDFSAFDPAYTSATHDAAMAEIAAAAAIPSESQRDADVKVARVELEGKTEEMLDMWQTLKLYIEKSFDESLWPGKIEAAGGNSYEKARNDNWMAAKKIGNDAILFIGKELVALTAHGLPATFRADFAGKVNDVQTAYATFTSLEMVRDEQTKKKNDADVAVYNTLKPMLKDGKGIFKNDESVKQFFTLSRLVKMVRGSHPATLRGWVKDEHGKLLKDVRIYAEDAPFDVETNNKGRYTITRIAAGEYRFVIDRAGYQAQEVIVKIRPGIANTLNIVMQAAEGKLVVAA